MELTEIGRSGRYTLGLLHEYRGTSSHFRVLGPLSRLYEAVEPACAACLRLIWPPNVRSLRPLRRNRGGYTYDGPDEPVATYRCRWALVPLRTPCGTVGPARDACLRPAGPRRGRVSCTDLVASCCVRPTWRLHVYGGPDEPDATDRCRWVLSRLRTSYEAVDPARVTCLRLARPSNVRSLIAAINGSKNA